MDLQNQKFRKVTIGAIGYTDHYYDNLIHKFFVTWCEAMAIRFYHNDRDLINSEALWKYYRNQWGLLVERRFVREYSGYLTKDIEDSREIYYKQICDYAYELEDYYPASLLKEKTLQKPKLEFNLN
ncbi:hypothetical protein ATE49_04925 [Elizabethkingia miricola]|uniref:Uncharacterized protein n=1 Tax=Elizabethkingia miricola TaxID=172045 RepID=A0ABY3NGU3_ELIMR|nr:hypothetical protein [Elizabethkingia miricola]OBS12567.1 hypothetical protein ATE49_04925 [Elizabethkingia miricola]TYO91953.1 hypothetical protein LX74_02204 [Elizabethkingia miricola]